MSNDVTAAVVVIGNEVLSGRTEDANIRYLALGLGELGIQLREVRIIPDVEAVIIDTVNALRSGYDYVFTTGGIGPTHDDITAESVAKAFAVPLLRSPEAVERLLRQIKPEDLNEARLRMANIPQGGILIDNPISHAPGFQIGNVFVMAGVPKIMRAMFDSLRPRLTGGDKIVSQSITLLTREGSIATPLAAIQSAMPSVEIGSYPFHRDPLFGAVIVARGADPQAVAAAIMQVRQMADQQGVAYQDGDRSVA